MFVLALAQRAEGRSPYTREPSATPAMAADEQIHEEVVRGLATRGRNRLAGTFRAAVFGANDGLVSNLSLVMGMAATGVGSGVVLLSGISGLLAGAFSMGAGEFVSVRSQRELLDATRPTQATLVAAPQLDIEHNELLLVYLARGMSREAAEHRVAERMGLFTCDCDPSLSLHPELPETEDEHEAVGTAWGAAMSSFCFFASGAIVPILPFIFGMTGMAPSRGGCSGGHRAAGHWRHRRPAVRNLAADPRPAAARHRSGSGRRHVPPGHGVWRRHRLIDGDSPIFPDRSAGFMAGGRNCKVSLFA